jgi:hypothetical protein
MIQMLKTLFIRMQKKKIDLTIQNFRFSSTIENIVNERNDNEQNDENAKFVFKKLKTKINFALNENEIMYHINTNSRRFCIFISIEREIFRLTHDENHHFKIHRCYDKIINILYIFRFFKKIRKYIEHCFIYQLTQIKRHRSYEKLMFITFASRSFHIIVIDFILILFDVMNTIMFVTCKHSRKTSLIFDKKIYDAKK